MNFTSEIMKGVLMMKVTKKPFGQKGNMQVIFITLVNNHGIEISIINYGCTITKMIVPDRDGNYENIVLGYDTLDEYLNGNSFFGCVVGRVAGRIGGASFDLNGETYLLAQNENENHLHGGDIGFDKVVWEAEQVETDNEVSVAFSYLSPDGEEGYPGNLSLRVIYTLTNDNQLSIRYEGISDKTTLLNVTNHTYFNLSGDVKDDVLDHELTLKSNQYLELGDDLLPTGKLNDVEGTVFDFQRGRIIRTGVESSDPNCSRSGRYYHPFVLQENHNEEIKLHSRENGRKMTIETDEVAVVVYSATTLSEEGTVNGVPSRPSLGICLETQGYPDAVNHSHFPSWVLEKDKPFTSVTTYQFSVE